MRPKALNSRQRITDLRDWTNLDLTGATDMSAIVQAWQDEAQAAGFIAKAPAGRIGLASQVVFKAPTIGAGGGHYGRHERLETNPPYTAFENIGITNRSWLIEVDTVNADRGDFGFVKGFRVFNDTTIGGRDCSLMRVRGVESVPAGFAWEMFRWDDIVGLGGWVNFEHYGYQGVIRDVHSRMARLSAFRAYLCNALRVEGGWFGASGTGAWDFEVFGRSSADYSKGEGSHGIIFNQTVFQPQPSGSGSNGLRISENTRDVILNAYFESHVPVGGLGGVALEVGWCQANHASPAIPVPVDIAGADRPTNDARRSATDIDLRGCTGGSGSAASG